MVVLGAGGSPIRCHPPKGGTTKGHVATNVGIGKLAKGQIQLRCVMAGGSSKDKADAIGRVASGDLRRKRSENRGSRAGNE